MTNPKRILAVDDDDWWIERVKKELEGYDLVCMEKPMEAIQLMRNQAFDLYVFDNEIEGPNIGANWLHALRKRGITAPIIIHSGEVTEYIAGWILENNGIYVQKQDGAGYLRDVVQKLLAA
jgi:CheY-like chemotaxis protein